MSNYMFIDPMKTPEDELFAAYLDDTGLIAYPCVNKVDGELVVCRNSQDIADAYSAALAGAVFDAAEDAGIDASGSVEAEEGIDLIPVFGQMAVRIAQDEVELIPAAVPEKCWEDECAAVYVEKFDMNYPVACFDEFGALWQVNNSLSMLDMFAGYVDGTFGREVDLRQCWDIFASECELTDAASLYRASMEGAIFQVIERNNGFVNTEAYMNADEGFIVRDESGDARMSDKDDFADHIVMCAQAAADLVPVLDLVARWTVFFRPSPRNLERAIEQTQVYIAGGWRNYPYTAEKVDDPSVQMRVGNAYDFLYLTSDVNIDEWIDQVFGDYPDIYDMAAHYLAILPEWRRY